MVFLLALIGLVAVTVVVWRAFGPDQDPSRGRALGPDDDPEFLRGIGTGPARHRPVDESGDDAGDGGGPTTTA